MPLDVCKLTVGWGRSVNHKHILGLSHAILNMYCKEVFEIYVLSVLFCKWLSMKYSPCIWVRPVDFLWYYNFIMQEYRAFIRGPSNVTFPHLSSHIKLFLTVSGSRKSIMTFWKMRVIFWKPSEDIYSKIN